MDIRSKFLGSFLGTAIGDSLGAGKEWQLIHSDEIEMGN